MLLLETFPFEVPILLVLAGGESVSAEKTGYTALAWLGSLVLG